MFFTPLLGLSIASITLARSVSRTQSCKHIVFGFALLVTDVSSGPEFSGDFNITNHELYPENSDFDSIHCKYYLRQINLENVSSKTDL